MTWLNAFELCNESLDENFLRELIGYHLKVVMFYLPKLYIYDIL